MLQRKTWTVKAHDGQTNNEWEVLAVSRQDAKDHIAVTYHIATTFLTAKVKKEWMQSEELDRLEALQQQRVWERR